MPTLRLVGDTADPIMMVVSLVAAHDRVLDLGTRPDIGSRGSRKALVEINRVVRQRRLQLIPGRYEMCFQPDGVRVMRRPDGGDVKPMLIATAERMFDLLDHLIEDRQLFPAAVEIERVIHERVLQGIHSALLPTLTGWTDRVMVRAICRHATPTSALPVEGMSFLIEFPMLRLGSPWQRESAHRFELLAGRFILRAVMRAISDYRTLMLKFFELLELEAGKLAATEPRPALVVVPPSRPRVGRLNHYHDTSSRP